jgi:hypothetical protein
MNRWFPKNIQRKKKEKVTTAGTGQAESRKRQAEQECHDSTSRTGRPGQAARIGKPAQECNDKTARAEQKGEDSQKRNDGVGQQEQDSQSLAARMGQNRTGRTKLPVLYRIARIRQQRQDRKGRKARKGTLEKDSQSRTVGIGQPKQDSQKKAARTARIQLPSILRS